LSARQDIAALKHAFAALVGAANVLDSAADMAAYETGARYDKGRAALVVRPADTAEVSAVVRHAVANGIRLIPQSGNTGLVSGSTPDESGNQVVLSLDRLNRVFELDRDNRSVRLDVGHRLSDVNARLEPEGLHFPIDLGADPRIGGMLATNTGGARFLRFGDVRKNVLGIKVVVADAEGTVLDFMSGLRKNNTGVDWKQVFIGTSGAFGIITECEINLELMPRQTAAALLVPREGAAVMPLLREMEIRLGSYLSAFEGMSRNAVESAFRHVGSLRNPFANGVVPDYAILAEVTRSWDARAGEQPLDAVIEEVLGEIWESAPGLLEDALVGSPAELWALRHALSEGVKHRGRMVAFDLAFRRQDVIAFCDWMKQNMPARFPDVAICDFGHIGDGGVHFNLVFEDASRYSAGRETELREWVYEVAVSDFGGSFSAEHGIGRKNQPTYDRYTHADVAAPADGLKSMISPGPLGAVRFGRN